MNIDSLLTKKEQFVLDYIRTYQNEYGTYPTYREIMVAVGASSINSVSQYLKQLEAKGEISLIRNKGYRLVHRESSDNGLFAFPLLGSVPAGSPNAAQEISETVALPTSFVRKPAQTYILQVKGMSMRDAGILPGDYLFVEQREAQPGDIVVAMLGGENTVKRLVADQGTWFLRAENADFPEIHPHEEWTIQGVVVGLWRNSMPH